VKKDNQNNIVFTTNVSFHRHSARQKYDDTMLRNEFANCIFKVRSVRNTLPPDLRSPHYGRRQFRSKLKTYLFRQDYNTA